MSVKMKIKNVLSLFDGVSCGQIALKELDIEFENYYASEIDKHAIKCTQHNFPKTIQLGSVVDVDVSKLGKIDLICGGSPCQSFSFAGKRKGMSTKCEIEITTLEQYMKLKSECFEFEGQSYLFWEYVRILKDVRKTNPNVLFLLENVEMGKKWERVLSEALGMYGVHINSALVSAQNRKRIYWTNIRTKQVGLFGDVYTDIPKPKERGILLKDILEDEVDEKYYLSDKMLHSFENNTKKQKDNKNGFSFKPSNGDKKSFTVTTQEGSRMESNYIITTTNSTNSIDVKCVASRGRGHSNEQNLEERKDSKSNCLTTAQKDNMVMQLNKSTESGGIQPYQQNRVYDTDGISPALLSQMNCGSHAIEIKSGTIRTHKDGNGFRELHSGKGACVPARAREDGSGQNAVQIGSKIRRLTPKECKRLQTIPDWYDMSIVSDTQAYKMLGNGWTIEVIKHIFSFIK